MSLKKMLAAVSGVILAAQTLLPVSVLGATNYGEELQGAYDYAYSEGITTQYPIDNANMYGAMTRAEMSKMLGQWAINTLGMTPDTSKSCSFTDTASVKGDLADWIIKSCQLGLMGQGVTAFRPYDTVTRGEFGTVLSRAIWGTANEGGTPYYAAHLQALKNAGIMTQITPDAKEVRGYVMIMLQRAASNSDVIAGGKGQCSDPVIQLACIMETDACPAICKDNGNNNNNNNNGSQVKAGDLDVAVTDYSSTIKSAPAVGTVIFNKVAFNASQTITLNTITVAIAGLTSRTSIDRVWFEKDGVALTSKVKPTTDGTASLTFKGNFVVKSTENLDFVVALSGVAGAEVSFKIANVDSSAVNVNLRDVTTSTYRTTAYKVAKLDITTDSVLTGLASTATPNSTFKLGAQTNYTIGKINIQNDGADNEDRIVNVKSVLLKNAQSTDLSFLKNIQVLRDGTNVAKAVTIEGRNMQITLNDTVQPGKRAIYTVVAEIGNMTDVPSYIQLQLQSLSDVVADEANTNFRTSNTTTFGGGTSTLYFDLYKFEGGKITFANDTSFPTVLDAAASSNDVTIASGTLTLSEPISFKAFSLTGNTSGIRRLSLELNGTRYVAESSDNGAVRTFTWDEIYVTRTANVKVIATLETAATGTITLTPSMISSDIFNNGGNYTNTDTNFTNAEIAGRIQIARINVTTPRFALNNNLSTTQTSVVGESATRTIFEGPLTSQKNITVDSITFTINDLTGVNFNGQNMDLDLLVNGSVVDSKTIKTDSGATATFNTNIAVNSTAKTVKIVASLASNGTGRIVAAVVANGTDADGNKMSSSSINTVAFRVLSEASVSVTNAGSTSQVVIEGANAKLTEFTVSVADGSTNLSQLVITGTALPAGATATLTLGNNTYQGTVDSANQLTFAGINANLQEGDYKAIVATNVNTDMDLTGRTLTVDKVVLTYTQANATTQTATGTINATYYFVKAFPMITVTSTSTKNQVTLRITNGNNQSITISGVNVAGSDVTIDGQIVQSGATYTSALARVYLDTPRTLARGESVEIVLKADSGKSPARLAGIDYTTTSAGSTYEYVLNNTYTNVGKWGDFTVSWSS